MRGERPTFPFVITKDGVDVGYVQWYRIDAYPEYADEVRAEAGAAGMDLFLCEAACGQGIAAEAVEEVLRDHAFRDPAVTHCLVGPDPDNVNAKRTPIAAAIRTARSSA